MSSVSIGNYISCPITLTSSPVLLCPCFLFCRTWITRQCFSSRVASSRTVYLPLCHPLPLVLHKLSHTGVSCDSSLQQPLHLGKHQRSHRPQESFGALGDSFAQCLEWRDSVIINSFAVTHAISALYITHDDTHHWERSQYKDHGQLLLKICYSIIG